MSKFPPTLSGKQFLAKQRGEEIELEDWQLAAQEQDAEKLEQRKQQVAKDIEEHGAVAQEWYEWQGHGDLVVQVVPKKASNGSLRQRTSSRPRGGRPPARSSSRSTRGSPDDDPEPEPPNPLGRTCDRLLAAARASNPDAYRVIPEADGWAWMARCPCAPDAGHTMFILDRGDDKEPGIACRHGCSTASIRRMLGYVTAEERELERRAINFLEELERYQCWVAERRAS